MKSPDYCSSDFGPRVDLRIPRGGDFRRIIQPMGEPTVYRPITAITSLTPARFKIGAGDDLPDSWLVGVPEVLASFGIPQYQPPPISQFYRANYTASDEIELANLNLGAIGGIKLPSTIQFKPPLTDLDGAEFVLDVRKDEDPDSVLLDSMSIFDGRIVLDAELYQILIRITKIRVAALTWKTGFYTGTLTTSAGETARLIAGAIQVV